MWSLKYDFWIEIFKRQILSYDGANDTFRVAQKGTKLIQVPLLAQETKSDCYFYK